MNLKYSFLIVGLASISLFSCKKSYLDTKPTTAESPDDVFSSTKNAYKAINGIHAFMTSAGGAHSQYGHASIMHMNDLLGNDWPVAHSSSHYLNVYNYTDIGNASSGTVSYVWSYYYSIINNANNILDRIDNVPGIAGERFDIKGQALAYRAFAYMNLIQYYQFPYLDRPDAPGIPIYTKGTTTETKPVGRGKSSDVYNQIYSDLKAAIENLSQPETKTHPSSKSHISAAAARGLMARLCLLMGKYGEALQYAGEAANNYTLANALTLNAGFNSNNNSEWIWGSTQSDEQIKDNGLATFFGWIDYDSDGYAIDHVVTKQLKDLVVTGDARTQWFGASPWFNQPRQMKFRVRLPNTSFGDIPFMRSSEMYLIAAEAAAKNDDIPTAKSMLTELLTVRGNTEVATLSDDKNTVLEFIYKQRRIELMGEGHAYFDLMRLKKGLNRPTGSGNHNSALALVTSIPYGDARLLFKIPQRELEVNPIEQN